MFLSIEIAARLWQGLLKEHVHYGLENLGQGRQSV
jgi:hypothetical protein